MPHDVTLMPAEIELALGWASVVSNERGEPEPGGEEAALEKKLRAALDE